VWFRDPDGGLATLGVRQQMGMAASDAAYNVRIGPDGAWTLHEYGTAIGTATVPVFDTYRLAIEARDTTIATPIDGKGVYTDKAPTPEIEGRVRLGGDFYETPFDNAKAEKIDGYAPYATAPIDNMDGSVAYDGVWSRKNANGDAMDWYRPTSTSDAAGASFTVPFTGTGIDVIGGNDGSAVFDVHLDGKLIAKDVKTTTSERHRATHMLRGLPGGGHAATFVLEPGKIVHAFDIISGDVDGTVGTMPIRHSLEWTGHPAQDHYTADSWARFDTASSVARAAVSGPRELDTIGVEQITDRLNQAYNRLVRAREDATTGQWRPSAHGALPAVRERYSWEGRRVAGNASRLRPR
jgi:hypothetical protein